MAVKYDHNQVEQQWQKVWEDAGLFQNTYKQDTNGKNKRFLLFAFAYPSGSGLHVGHVESKTALDIMARFYRMSGDAVFFPVGWDAFGLPAENFAIKSGIPPAETTKNAINTFRRQIRRIGISYDWEAELATSHPEYYKWTQWIFAQLYKKGLAYQKEGSVNWCPSCQTVLANEQVVNGTCERCDSTIQQKNLKQWYFKITKYQDELISGLDTVDWPEPTKHQQIHWIGKSKGANVRFPFENSELSLECFTTRIDTIAGVTFVVVSPEKYQALGLDSLVDPQKRAQVAQYVETAFSKTEEMRKVGEKDKGGVHTGVSVINPVTKAKTPVFVADYVLAGYGTGAVMGVPAHDSRDMAFAKAHQIPVVQVIAPSDAKLADEVAAQVASGTSYDEYGVLVNSGEFTGMSSQEAQHAIPAKFADSMNETTTYKLRDWLISRQRYWGAPIPVVYDPEGNPHLVKEEHLPWMLPTDVEFKPTGESPLRDSKEFIQRVEKLYGKGWTPEFDTMDTFVDSSWYFLRYCDPRNTEVFASPEQLKKWLSVDLYMIGPEHIVLHLLYSRFFTKFLRDEGYLTIDEPFAKMRHQGMILGPDGKKMSKSKGNVITPDEVIQKFGADTLRVYEMFMGPLEADKPWDVSAVMGVYKFLQRVYDLVKKSKEASFTQTEPTLLAELHQVIAKVSADIPLLKYNTATAKLMEFINSWEKAVKSGAGLSVADTINLVKIIAPFAPFLAEELWHILSNEDSSVSVHTQSWPSFDPALATPKAVCIAVQVDGKLRGTLDWSADATDQKDEIISQAKALEGVARFLEGKAIARELYVPGKIVNFVTR